MGLGHATTAAHLTDHGLAPTIADDTSSKKIHLRLVFEFLSMRPSKGHLRYTQQTEGGRILRILGWVVRLQDVDCTHLVHCVRHNQKSALFRHHGGRIPDTTLRQKTHLTELSLFRHAWLDVTSECSVKSFLRPIMRSTN